MSRIFNWIGKRIEKIWNVEQQFKYEEDIFSFMSVASVVHQMTDMQSTKIKEQILTISDGLGEISGGIMYLLGLKYTPITATLGALVLGMGTEMTIMLLERYLEERKSGKHKLEAILITVTMIGKATVVSGLTTIGGFSVLMTSKFVILKDFGLMTVINISLALMSIFIILPAVLVLLDRFIVGREEIKNI